MLAKRIIPCLDIKDGRVVKGTQFVSLKDAGDPVELASRYNQAWADELVFLDITASHEARATTISLATELARLLFIPFTIGGGIRTLEDIHQLVTAGADKISINTSAIERPALITEAAEHFGSQCVVVAMDVKKHQTGWQVYTHGGRNATGKDAVQWACEIVDRGAGEILLTSMDCDGQQTGFDLDITAAISEQVSIPVIASGGGGTTEHFYDAFTKGKADAVLGASVFHYESMTVLELKQYLHAEGIPVRLPPAEG